MIAVNNYFNHCLDNMILLCGDSFNQLWVDFMDAYNNDIQEDVIIPAKPQICALIRFCLTRIEILHKRERCIIISFMFSFLLKYPKFVRCHHRFLRTAVDKAHELLRHDYLRHGHEPICVSILQQFVQQI